MSQIEEFITAAKEFTDWCVSKPLEESQEAQQALFLLVQLYSLAIRLRVPSDIDSEIEGQRTDDKTWRSVYKRAGALPLQYYTSVFDPKIVPAEEDEPVTGDLADDIADIHRDVSEGLSLALAGNLREAEWHFSESFRYHWGHHTISAIRALHSWLFDGGC